MRWTIALCISLCLFGLIIPGTVGGSASTSEYSITLANDDADQQLSVPEWEISHSELAGDDNLEDADYLVDRIAYVSHDETLDFEIPDNRSLGIETRDADSNVADTWEENGIHTVEKTNPPGTYVTMLTEDGVDRAIQPFVISGFSFTVDDTPDAAQPGSTARIDFSVSEAGASFGEVNGVEVGLAADDHSIRKDAFHATDNEYYADLSIPDDIQSGEYQVYAAVRGSNIIDDQYERLALAPLTTIDVSTDSGGNGGDRGGDNGDSTEESLDVNIGTQPISPNVGEKVTFDADHSATETQLTYNWSISAANETSTVDSRSINHTFDSPGLYTVSVSVSEQDAIVDTAETEINVTAAESNGADGPQQLSNETSDADLLPLPIPLTAPAIALLLAVIIAIYRSGEWKSATRR